MYKWLKISDKAKIKTIENINRFVHQFHNNEFEKKLNNH